MNDSTLNSVSSYLSTFERSYGKSDAGIRSAIRAMSDAAGTKDAMAMQSVMRSYGHIPEEESGRTMIWLADVASYSNQQDRHDLPPRIFSSSTSART